jgi:hypothetical protein
MSGEQMRYFSIDEDTLNALIDLIQDACIQCQEINDPDTEKFYQYMLGELEHAKHIGTTPKLTPEEEARLKKVERYLRMLQQGLIDPTNEKENKKRRDFARGIVRDEEKQVTEKREKVEHIVPLTKEELNKIEFEQYYEAREVKLGRIVSLDTLLKKSGVKKNK